MFTAAIEKWVSRDENRSRTVNRCFKTGQLVRWNTAAMPAIHSGNYETTCQSTKSSPKCVVINPAQGPWHRSGTVPLLAPAQRCLQVQDIYHKWTTTYRMLQWRFLLFWDLNCHEHHAVLSVRKAVRRTCWSGRTMAKQKTGEPTVTGGVKEAAVASLWMASWCIFFACKT